MTLLVLCVTGAWAQTEVSASWLPSASGSSLVTTGTSTEPEGLTANALTYSTTTLEYVENWSRNSKYYTVFYNKDGVGTDTKGTINVNKYVDFTVTVPSGKRFTPSEITMNVTGRSTSNNSYRVDFNDGTTNTTIQSVTSAGSGADGSVSYEFVSPSTYEEGTTLKIRFYFGINNSTSGRGIGLCNVKIDGSYEEAAVAGNAPETPTFTPNGGDVNGCTTTTIASTYAQKIYYCWTSSATAPAQDAEDTWTEANGDSKVFTIPNVTAANMYLHAYGWNNYNTSTKSATNTSNAFNVTRFYSPAKTYNFASAFSDELKAILVHETTGKFVLNGGRYVSKAKIDKDTDNDLGTYSGVTEWNGLVFGRTGNDITASNLRIQENGYIQINGGDGYYKLEGLYDGDVVRVRCASANADITNTRKFTVTGATVDEISVKGSDAGYYEFELTKAGNGDFSIKQDNGINLWVISVNQTLPAVPEVAVSTADGNTYATYVTSYALDFSTVSEDITAYIVTDKETSTVTTEAVTMVPARTAILVKTKSAGVTVDVPRASGATALSTNKLKYSSTDIEVKSENENVGKIYAFFKVAGQYGFAPVAEDTKLPARKAYLQIEGGELQANFLALDLDGETTAINKVEAAKQNAGEYFNLAGQRVAQPTKGLYIVNGKKVVLK